MSEYGNEGSMLSRMITWLFVAILAIAALKMAFWVLGVVVGVGGYLIFGLGPILLVGWLVIKVYRHLTRPSSPPVA